MLRVLKGAGVVAGLWILAWGALVAVRRPSLSRDWSEDQALLPIAAIQGNRVEIRNVRNFAYTSEKTWTPRYETRVLDLRNLDSLWFVMERFGGREGIAHTFLTYGFGDQYVSISVEIRKEKGESYSPLRGLLREYELMYVIGDERDLVGLRTNYRHDEVRLYPVRTTPEKMRAVFLDQLERANSLARRPEFYNTLTNTCTTNIVRHVNTIAPHRIPFSFRVLLPAYSDSLAYELGLIDTSLPLDAARRVYRIDQVAQRAGVGPDFSSVIRAGLPRTRVAKAE